MIIREAIKSDAKFMASAIEYGFNDGWNLSVLENSFDSGRFFGKIADINGKPVGFITYSISVDDADIESVFVLPSCRRQGVAELLYNSAEQSIIDKKLEKIFLEVKVTNTSAYSLYKKSGFNDLSVRKKYYPDGSDAVVMVKELKL